MSAELWEQIREETMKRNIIPFLGGLLALGLVGVGVMIAQERSTFNVPVPPPAAGGDTVMYYNNDDGDEPGDDVLIEAAPHAGAPMAAIQGPGMRKFVFRGDEGGGAWLGVTIGDVNAEKAKELKLAGEYGAFVKEVHENSPAAKAGLQKDDVIVEFAGEKVRSAAQVRRLVRETPADRTVTLVVNRAGQTKTLSAKLEPRSDRVFEMPAPAIAATPMPHIRVPEFNFAWADRGARLGISADELTSQLAQYFGVKQGKGILVREVVVGSAAEKAGLKAGDVIVAADGKEVASVGALRRALTGDAQQKEKRKLALTIVRDKHEQTLTVEVDVPQHVGPRRMAMAEPVIAPEDAEDLAADIQAQSQEIEEQAREWQENQKEFQKEQEELQQEMQQLKEELPKEIEKEIIRNQTLQGLRGSRAVV